MGTLIAWVLVRDRFFGKRVARRRHRRPVRAADDRRRAGAAVALRAGQPHRRRRRQHPAAVVPRAGLRDAAVRRAHRAAGAATSTGTSRRRRPRSAPAGCTIFRRIVLPALPRRSLPAPRSRSPGGSASTARWCCSPATCRRTEVASVRVLSFIENGNQAQPPPRSRRCCWWSCAARDRRSSTSSSGRRGPPWLSRPPVRPRDPARRRYAPAARRVGYVGPPGGLAAVLVLKNALAPGSASFSRVLCRPRVPHALR